MLLRDKRECDSDNCFVNVNFPTCCGTDTKCRPALPVSTLCVCVCAGSFILFLSFENEQETVIYFVLNGKEQDD